MVGLLFIAGSIPGPDIFSGYPTVTAWDASEWE